MFGRDVNGDLQRNDGLFALWPQPLSDLGPVRFLVAGDRNRRQRLKAVRLIVASRATDRSDCRQRPAIIIFSRCLFQRSELKTRRLNDISTIIPLSF